jgi:hypothetical protein
MLVFAYLGPTDCAMTSQKNRKGIGQMQKGLKHRVASLYNNHMVIRDLTHSIHEGGGL